MQRDVISSPRFLGVKYGLEQSAEEKVEMIGLFVANRRTMLCKIDGYVSIIEAVCDHVNHPGGI